MNKSQIQATISDRSFDTVMLNGDRPDKVSQSKMMRKDGYDTIGIFAFEVVCSLARKGLKDEVLSLLEETQRRGYSDNFATEKFTYRDENGNVIMPIFTVHDNGLVAVLCTESGIRFGDEQIVFEENKIPSAIYNKYCNKSFIGKMPSVLAEIIGFDLDPYVTSEGIRSVMNTDLGFDNSMMGVFWMTPKTMDIMVAMEKIREI